MKMTVIKGFVHPKMKITQKYWQNFHFWVN